MPLEWLVPLTGGISVTGRQQWKALLKLHHLVNVFLFTFDPVGSVERPFICLLLDVYFFQSLQAVLSHSQFNINLLSRQTYNTVFKPSKLAMADDDAPPQLVDLGGGGTGDDEQEITVKVPITIVTGSNLD
jgi:hypothetical protein